MPAANHTAEPGVPAPDDGPPLRRDAERNRERILGAARGVFAAEGIEALKEACGSVDRVLAQLIGGIQSGMGYLGAANLAQLREKARYIRVSPAGQREAAPHDVVELKTGN